MPSFCSPRKHPPHGAAWHGAERSAPTQVTRSGLLGIHLRVYAVPLAPDSPQGGVLAAAIGFYGPPAGGGPRPSGATAGTTRVAVERSCASDFLLPDSSAAAPPMAHTAALQPRRGGATATEPTSDAKRPECLPTRRLGDPHDL